RPTSQHQITLATREPSTEDTLTAGVVLQPNWIPGLRLSVDYYDISIDGQIGSLSADDILRQCFEENVTVFCDAVTTGPGGQIQGVVRQFENLDKFETRGIDFEAAYRTSVSRSADMNFRVLANYTDKLATTAAASRSEE